MRNLIIFLTVLFLSGLSTTTVAQRFEGALLGGFNMSQLDGDDLLGYRQIGINGGVRANAVLSERWRLSLALLYSQQGSRRGGVDDLGRIDKIRLNFVEVPVLLNFREWKFDVSAGLSYNRLINFEYIEVTGEDVTDLQDFRDNVLGLVFGATFYFEENLGVNVHWSRFLSSIDANPVNSRLIGRTISIRLMYLL